LVQRLCQAAQLRRWTQKRKAAALLALLLLKKKKRWRFWVHRISDRHKRKGDFRLLLIMNAFVEFFMLIHLVKCVQRCSASKQQHHEFIVVLCNFWRFFQLNRRVSYPIPWTASWETRRLSGVFSHVPWGIWLYLETGGPTNNEEIYKDALSNFSWWKTRRDFEVSHTTFSLTL